MTHGSVGQGTGRRKTRWLGARRMEKIYVNRHTVSPSNLMMMPPKQDLPSAPKTNKTHLNTQTDVHI